MNREVYEKLTKHFVDQGKLIEVGYLSFLYAVVPKGTPEWQLVEMRRIFFAGAQHLFASIITMLDAGSEPTQKDVDRFTLIREELDEFYQQMKKEIANGMQFGSGPQQNPVRSN